MTINSAKHILDLLLCSPCFSFLFCQAPSSAPPQATEAGDLDMPLSLEREEKTALATCLHQYQEHHPDVHPNASPASLQVSTGDST